MTIRAFLELTGNFRARKGTNNFSFFIKMKVFAFSRLYIV
ncbi:hypothetical protein HMPREF0880_03609 [Yokenella regensburgei ATCC 43003]|nr:hypothetical protein HMPREF0880_03609 [Yokenella regensburgei ATCC 43003]